MLSSALCTTASHRGTRSLQVGTGSDFWYSLAGSPNGPDLTVSVVPFKFCAAGWANAPQEGLPHNAIFHQRSDPVESHEDLMKHDNLRIQVTRRIKKDAEVVFWYGAVYDHWG